MNLPFLQKENPATGNSHMFSNRELWALLLPLMVEQLLNSLMGTADTIMVSNVGSAAMSAVSLVDSINILVIQAFSALAAGGCIICSQYVGKKSLADAERAAKQVLLVVLVISVVIAGIGLSCNRSLLRLVFGQVEDDVMDAAVVYFYYTASSYPFIALYNAGAAIYRAQGNSKRPMRISIVSNLMNIVGNAIFIWGFDMGVAGAALSTLLSRIFCAVVVLAYLHKSGQTITVNEYHRIRPQWALIWTVLAIGVPSGIENSMFQFGKLVIQSTVSTMGTAAIAAQAMTNIMENLNGVAPMGMGIGLMTIVGQCIGAGRKDEAVYYVKKVSLWAEAALIISCLAVYGITKPVTILGAMEAESADLCFYMVGWITLIKPIFWIGSFIPAYGMRAAGDVKFSMITSTITMWLCRVTLCIFLVRTFGFGPMAVWIGMFSDWALRSVIFTVRFHSRRWLEHKVIS